MDEPTGSTTARVKGELPFQEGGPFGETAEDGGEGGCPSMKKGPPVQAGLRNNVLAPFYFPTQEYAVSSTMESLTAEFGMGSGVPSPPGAPRQISLDIN